MVAVPDHRIHGRWNDLMGWIRDARTYGVVHGRSWMKGGHSGLRWSRLMARPRHGPILFHPCGFFRVGHGAPLLQEDASHFALAFSLPDVVWYLLAGLAGPRNEGVALREPWLA